MIIHDASHLVSKPPSKVCYERKITEDTSIVRYMFLIAIPPHSEHGLITVTQLQRNYSPDRRIEVVFCTLIYRRHRIHFVEVGLLLCGVWPLLFLLVSTPAAGLRTTMKHWVHRGVVFMSGHRGNPVRSGIAPLTKVGRILHMLFLTRRKGQERVDGTTFSKTKSRRIPRWYLFTDSSAVEV